MRKPTAQVGDIFVTQAGCSCVVVKYEHNKAVTVRFLDRSQHEQVVRLDHLKNGKIRNPFRASLFGIGYTGVGRFKPSIGGRDTKEYTSWYNMMRRCYSPEFVEQNPTYLGCTVHPDWHNFQSFAEWLADQPNWGRDGFDLDKDLIKLGNKEYGPDACSIVPHSINSLLGLKKERVKRSDAPDGVSWCNNKRKYVAQCWNGEGKNVHLGRFSCPDRASLVYRDYKESLTVKFAEEFKEILDVRVYRNLKEYRVV